MNIIQSLEKSKKALGSGNKQNAYKKCTCQERYEIGKYATEYGSSAAINHSKSKNLKESTFRAF